MAARTPTDYTNYVNEDGLLPRKQVLSAAPSSAVDDQCYIHQKPDMLVSDFFYMIGGDLSTIQYLRPYFITLDLCGTAATKDCKFTICCSTFSGSSDFEVGIYNATTTTQYTYTVTANHTTRSWRAYTTVTIQADGTEQELWLTYRDPGGSFVGVAGVGIFID